MILQALNDLYDRIVEDGRYQVAREGFSSQKVTFKVVVAPDGRLFDISDARIPDGDRLSPRPVIVPGDAKPSGSGINPGFLWDNSAYMLGFRADDEQADRTAQSFAAFRTRHLRHESEIASPSFSAVCRFLESWDPARAAEFPVLRDAGAIGFGVFQIEGDPSFVHDDDAVLGWWRSQADGEEPSVVGQCLVTGDRTELARLHPKVKGVAGAQGSGATVAGFNEPAYESLGKKQSLNAPVSKQVAFRYVTALNAMLDGPMSRRHRFRLGDTTVALWTDRPAPAEDIFARFISEGTAGLEEAASQDEALRQRVAAFLRALREGRDAYGQVDDDPERTGFFLLGLSPNAARLSIRYFHQGSIRELLDRLRRHHRDIRVVRPTGKSGSPAYGDFPPLWLLLRQSARDAKDVSPVLAGPLLRAVIGGTAYPEALYAGVIRRLRIGDPVDHLKASVIKGYLNRNLGKEVSMALDPGRSDPPYRLGRLFAALEKTQGDALGGINKTIRDAYYGSASSTPGLVFPRLLRTYQHHLAKLEGGRKTNREKLVQEILGPIERFPAHLDLADQGSFAIGYYHQKEAFYTKKTVPSDPGGPTEGDER